MLFQILRSHDQSDQGESSSNSIAVENVSKRFRIPHERRRTFFENLVAVLGKQSFSFEEFWVLQEISFSVQKGEAFGVIGPNGSGKSTLLKILASVLYPDSGRVTINGKVAPFLELGVGFQPDLTAKENVFIYGAIMGLSRNQIQERYDDILEFAELRRFESMKLRNFSSGMYVRLAFSTAIHTDPDIMLVDEVLAVGDESFRQKCSCKIDEFRKVGKTILLVSHQLQTVKELCDRSMLLLGGCVAAIGDTMHVVEEYQRRSKEIPVCQTTGYEHVV